MLSIQFRELRHTPAVTNSCNIDGQETFAAREGEKREQITPDITIYNAAAPAVTLRLLIYALILGAILLFPSLIFLFRIFKGKDAS